MKSILMMFLAMQMATSHFALASAPTTFEQAKVELRQKVYYDRNTSEAGDLYCGCDWKWVGRSGGRVDFASCGYEVRAQENGGWGAMELKTNVSRIRVRFTRQRLRINEL